ncbi:hypothetical protein C5S32_11970 [ANME-1 cluster archaeon GoMg1]|nr:hypothetical protein [ANME-1 cluster archaeon GoMg1]
MKIKKLLCIVMSIIYCKLKEIKRSKSGEVIEKIVVLKDVPYSEAKNMVDGYLKSHETAYMYEMSNDLGLDLRMVDLAVFE